MSDLQDNVIKAAEQFKKAIREITKSDVVAIYWLYDNKDGIKTGLHFTENVTHEHACKIMVIGCHELAQQMFPK